MPASRSFRITMSYRDADIEVSVALLGATLHRFFIPKWRIFGFHFDLIDISGRMIIFDIFVTAK